MEAEHVFKALADHHRRHLLDLLFQRDGQTLGELCAHLPMTRYGVMKHLQVLEEAELITTRKVGREKFHYLNPVPIQQVYDRWVSKYAQPFTNALVQLKQRLENPPMPDKHVHIYSIYINATPETIWRGLTDGTMTPLYYFGTAITSTWQKGAPYQYLYPDGKVALEGEILEIDPPRKLVKTFHPLWDEESAKIHGVVTFEIEAQGALCKVTVTHEDSTGPIHPGFIDAWSLILSGLKSVLETGQPLPTPAGN